MELRPWQQEAYDKLQELDFKGVIKVASGKGKTVLGIRVIEELKSKGKVLVVVPTINLMFQWEKEIDRFLPGVKCSYYYGEKKDESGDVILSVINTASTLPFQSEFALKIFDEVHHYGAPLYTSVFSIPSQHTIGMSATPEREDEGTLAIKFGVGDIVYSLDHVDELLDHFSLWSIRVSFTPEEYEQYQEYQSEIYRLQGQIASMYSVYDFQGIKRLGNKGNKLALRTLKLWGQQAHLKYNATHKLDAIKDIVAIEKGQKIIVFSESIAFAERVGDEIENSYVVHSKLGKKTVMDRLTAFRNATSGALIAPRMIDEGYDVPDANVAIIASFSRSTRQMIQRDGRILRFHNKDYAKRYTLVLETIEENKYYSIIERTRMTEIARDGMWVKYDQGFDEDPSFAEGFESYLKGERGQDFYSWVKKKLDYFETIYRDPHTMTERTEFYEQYQDVIAELVETDPDRWPSMKPVEVPSEEEKNEEFYFKLNITEERKRQLKEELRSINSRLELPEEVFTPIIRFLDSEEFEMTDFAKQYIHDVTSNDEPGIWPEELYNFLKYTFRPELERY